MSNNRILIDYDSLDEIVKLVKDADKFCEKACNDISNGNKSSQYIDRQKIEESVHTVFSHIEKFNKQVNNEDQEIESALSGHSLDLTASSSFENIGDGNEEFDPELFVSNCNLMIDALGAEIEAKEKNYQEQFGDNTASTLDFRFTYEESLEIYQTSMQNALKGLEQLLPIEDINQYLKEKYGEGELTYDTIASLYEMGYMNGNLEAKAKYDEIMQGGFNKLKESNSLYSDDAIVYLKYDINAMLEGYAGQKKEVLELLGPAVEAAQEIRTLKESKRQLEIYSYSYILEIEEVKSYTEDVMKAYLSEEQLHYFNREEAKIYTYLMKENRTSEAENFMELMTDTINQRKGMEWAVEYAQDITNKEGDWFYDFLRSGGEGTWDGIVNFKDGVVNFFSPDGKVSAEQYKQQYIMTMLSQEYDMASIGEQYGENSEEYQMFAKMNDINYNWLLNLGYQTGMSTGNMLPSIAVGWIPLVGKPLAMGSMFLSSAGNSVESAYQRGTTGMTAYLYGSLMGLSETGLEYVLGGIPVLSKASGLTLKSILGEGLEESIQTFIEKGANYAFFGEKIDWSTLPEEEIMSFGMGCFMSVCLNGGSTVINLNAQGIKVITSSDVELFMKKDASGNVSFDAMAFGNYLVGATAMANGNYENAAKYFSKSNSFSLLNSSNLTELLSNLNNDYITNIINNGDIKTTSLIINNMSDLRLSSLIKTMDNESIQQVLKSSSEVAKEKLLKINQELATNESVIQQNLAVINEALASTGIAPIVYEKGIFYFSDESQNSNNTTQNNNGDVNSFANSAINFSKIKDKVAYSLLELKVKVFEMRRLSIDNKKSIMFKMSDNEIYEIAMNTTDDELKTICVASIKNNPEYVEKICKSIKDSSQKLEVLQYLDDQNLICEIVESIKFHYMRSKGLKYITDESKKYAIVLSFNDNRFKWECLAYFKDEEYIYNILKSIDMNKSKDIKKDVMQYSKWLQKITKEEYVYELLFDLAKIEQLYTHDGIVAFINNRELITAFLDQELITLDDIKANPALKCSSVVLECAIKKLGIEICLDSFNPRAFSDDLINYLKNNPTIIDNVQSEKMRNYLNFVINGNKETVKLLRAWIEENPYIYDKIDLAMLSSDILGMLGADRIKEMVMYPKVQEKVLKIYNDGIDKFNLFCEIIGTIGDYNSNVLYQPYVQKIIEFFSNKNLNNVLSMIGENYANLDNPGQIKALIMSLCFNSNTSSVSLVENFQRISSVNDINNLFVNYLNDLKHSFQHTFNLQTKKDMALQALFGISLDQAKKLLSEFNNQVGKIELSGDVKKMFNKINAIVNYNLGIKLPNIDYDVSLVYEVSLLLEQSMKNAWSSYYMERTFKTDGKPTTIVKTVVTDENGNTVEYDVPIYNATADSILVVHKKDAYHRSNLKFVESNDYYEQYMTFDEHVSGRHHLSVSVISPSKIKIAQADAQGLIYGYSSWKVSALTDMSNIDVYSESEYAIWTGVESSFQDEKKLLRRTENYNELVFERSGIIPSYMIITDDMSQDLIQKTYQSAYDWGIPVVRVGKGG